MTEVNQSCGSTAGGCALERHRTQPALCALLGPQGRGIPSGHCTSSCPGLRPARAWRSGLLWLTGILAPDILLGLPPGLR